MSQRNFLQKVQRLKEKRMKEITPQGLEQARLAAQMNGRPQQQQLHPIPVACTGVIALDPAAKLCWDLYFGLVTRNFEASSILSDQDMGRERKKYIADECMEMAITALERVGVKINDTIPPGWNLGE